MAEGVDVVVVSYNTRELTMRCVRALLASRGVRPNVTVVDNGSTDGSVEALSECFPLVEVIALDENRGFGAANNLGIRTGAASYVAFINSDAFVQVDTLYKLMEYQLQHPAVGVAGPRILNEDGSLQKSCFRFPTPWRVWLENTGFLWLTERIAPSVNTLKRGACLAQSVDWLSGAAFMVRRSVVAEVGGFDENFFLYSEETDWQFRIRRSGWKIVWVPEAQVVHLGGGSGGGGGSPRVREWFFESVDRYFRKHYGLSGVLHLRAATAFGAGLRLLFGWLGGTRKGSQINYSWVLRRQLTKGISGG